MIPVGQCFKGEITHDKAALSLNLAPLLPCVSGLKKCTEAHMPVKCCLLKASPSPNNLIPRTPLMHVTIRPEARRVKANARAGALSLFDSSSLRLLDRCPNLLSLSLSGCGHVTDQDVVSVLRSCGKLRRLHLENCVRITDGCLRGAAAHGGGLEEVRVDFCRNVSREGLQAVREGRPSVQLRADMSVEMIPDRKPEVAASLRSALQKVLMVS